MRARIAVGLIFIVLLLQLLSLSSLLTERSQLVKNSAETEGAPMSLQIDYTVCYHVLGGNVSNKIIEIPYANYTKYVRKEMLQSACIDLPPEASDFAIPLIWDSRISHNFAFRSSVTKEPGMLVLEYQNDIVILMELIVERAVVSVNMEGDYKLIIEELYGEKSISSRVFECASSCTIVMEPSGRITAFSIYVEKERIPKRAIDVASVALIIITLLLISHRVPQSSHKFLRLRGKYMAV